MGSAGNVLSDSSIVLVPSAVTPFRHAGAAMLCRLSPISIVLPGETQIGVVAPTLVYLVARSLFSTVAREVAIAIHHAPTDARNHTKHRDCSCLTQKSSLRFPAS